MSATQPGGEAYETIRELLDPAIDDTVISLGEPRPFVLIGRDRVMSADWLLAKQLSTDDSAPQWFVPVLVHGAAADLATIDDVGVVASVGGWDSAVVVAVQDSAAGSVFVGAGPMGLFMVDAAGRFRPVDGASRDAMGQLANGKRDGLTSNEFRMALRDAVSEELAAQPTDDPQGPLVGGPQWSSVTSPATDRVPSLVGVAVGLLAVAAGVAVWCVSSRRRRRVGA